MDEAVSDALRTAVRQRLESLQAAGVRQLPKAKARAAVQVDSTAVAAVVEEPRTKEIDVPKGRAKPQAAELFEVAVAEEDAGSRVVSTAPTLEVLKQEVAGCTLCGELARTRTQTVFGVGNPKARLCFLGEAPGADEDKQGEPFVGRAGQLLNKILEACKLRREDVYILNILKCRPPGNRNPAPDEAANCRRFLERQLELIEPEFICLLGAVAAQNLFGTTEAIGKMRGRVMEYRQKSETGVRTINVVATYHPAYLLRNPSAKKYTWDDMKLLMREMGTPID